MSLENQINDLESQIEELSNRAILGFPFSSIVIDLIITFAAMYLIAIPKYYP